MLGFAAWNGRLYVFGGWRDDLPQGHIDPGDLHEYNVELAAWTNLSVPKGGRPPPDRYGHGLGSSNGRLYVFGGFGRYFEYNDLHEYDIAAK
eukprot:3877850-Rhodomonas_salina.1